MVYKPTNITGGHHIVGRHVINPQNNPNIGCTWSQILQWQGFIIDKNGSVTFGRGYDLTKFFPL